MTHKPIITKAGTELPMLDLRGKPYLQVAHRLVWFREEHSDWAIETEMVEHDAMHAIFRASIRRPERGELVATATGHETKSDFADFIEKAETKAIGRALAMCGYGTQFAPELDEGDRLADAPIAPAKPAAKPPLGQRKFSATEPATADEKKEIAHLATAKLGAVNGAEIIAKLNEKFAFSLVSSDDITHIKADTIIKALGAMPDLATEA